MSIFFFYYVLIEKKSCVFCFLSQQTHQRRDESFGELLQAASTIGDLRNCPVSIFFYPFVFTDLSFCWSLFVNSSNVICITVIHIYFYCILNWSAPTYSTTWYCSQFLKYFITVVLMRLKLLFCFFFLSEQLWSEDPDQTGPDELPGNSYHRLCVGLWTIGSHRGSHPLAGASSQPLCGESHLSCGLHVI